MSLFIVNNEKGMYQLTEELKLIVEKKKFNRFISQG